MEGDEADADGERGFRLRGQAKDVTGDGELGLQGADVGTGAAEVEASRDDTFV